MYPILGPILTINKLLTMTFASKKYKFSAY